MSGMTVHAYNSDSGEERQAGNNPQACWQASLAETGSSGTLTDTVSGK